MTPYFKFLLIPFCLFTFLLLSPNTLASLLSFQDNLPSLDLIDDFDPTESLAFFNNQPVFPNLTPPKTNQILGDTDPGTSKRIEVDLTNQRLYGFENDRLVYNFLISSGKWDRTPIGNFKVWIKVRSQKMSGGSKELGTYYYLPNVPYIMFFYNDQVPKKYGYSLHGTYWHNNFGIPMSHGCINMKTEEVAQIYSWAEVGIPITIYGKYQSKLPS